MILLSELNLEEAIRRSDKHAVAYNPAYKLLLEILNDKDQLEAIHIAAVSGLTRILLYGELIELKRVEIAKSLVEHLQRTDTHYWYQSRLVKALSAVDTLYIGRSHNKEEVVLALTSAMMDKNRHWMVRSEAAKSLGRLPMKQATAVEVSKLIVDLTQQMATEFNKAPNKFFWKGCYWDAYLAFKTESAHVAHFWPAPGLLAGNGSGRVKDAYTAILPLVKHVLKQQPVPIPNGLISATTQWLQDNPPNGNVAKILPIKQSQARPGTRSGPVKATSRPE